jgi:hypothetical protein
MVFRVQAESVKGELVHSFFDEDGDFTGLELIEVTGKVPRTPYGHQFWALRYDGNFLYRRDSKLFTFESVGEGIAAVEKEYSRWVRSKRKR